MSTHKEKQEQPRQDEQSELVESDDTLNAKGWIIMKSNKRALELKQQMDERTSVRVKGYVKKAEQETSDSKNAAKNDISLEQNGEAS